MADGGDDFPGSGGDFDGGENQDVCSFYASIFQQRQSVERLINWLRESQTTCTDTNCFDDLSGLSGTEHGAPSVDNPSYGDTSYETDAFTLVLWFVVGILTLYAMNLARDRQLGSGLASKANKSSSRSGDDQSRFRRNNDDDHSRPAL